MIRRNTDYEFCLICDLGNGLEILAVEQSLHEIKSRKQDIIEERGIWPAIMKRRKRDDTLS